LSILIFDVHPRLRHVTFKVRVWSYKKSTGSTVRRLFVLYLTE